LCGVCFAVLLLFLPRKRRNFGDSPSVGFQPREANLGRRFLDFLGNRRTNIEQFGLSFKKKMFARYF
jgi:hypothetical protein